MTPPAPSAVQNIRTAAGTLVLAVLGALALINIPLPSPSPPGGMADLAVWWEQVGTATAAMTLLRATMLVVTGYVALVSGLATVSAMLPCLRLDRIWRRLAVPSLRRHLAGGVLVVTSLTPGIAMAQEHAPIVLADIGSADTVDYDDEAFDDEAFDRADSPVLSSQPAAVESGPTPGQIALGLQRPRVSEVADAWLVEPGDHLWKIAEATLSQVGHNPTEPEVAHYWRQVIDANLRQLNGNPNLIYPGQIITLPPQPTAGS